MACYIFYRRFLVPHVITPRITLINCDTNAEKIISCFSQIVIEQKILAIDAALVSFALTYNGMITTATIGDYLSSDNGAVMWIIPIITVGLMGLTAYVPLHIASFVYPIYRIGKQTLQKNLYIPKLP